MGDRAYTTVRAWPWPGEDALPQEARDALAATELDGIDAATDGELHHASLVEGNESSGLILTIVNEEANYGIEAYREIIAALHAAGLNVFATNGAGGDYDAEWEYSPAGQEPVVRTVSEAAGETVIGAAGLLERCKDSVPDAADLTSVADAVVGAAAKHLLAEPDLPQAVWDAI